MKSNLTPQTPLQDGETVLHSFQADKATYLRANTWLAAAAMAAGMFVLWLVGNPDIWTGAVGGLAAIALRAFYMRSEEMAVRWDLTNMRLLGPMDRVIRLEDIAKFNTLGNVTQIITLSGDKHLIKYQPNPKHTVSTIERVRAGGGA